MRQEGARHKTVFASSRQVHIGQQHFHLLKRFLLQTGKQSRARFVRFVSFAPADIGLLQGFVAFADFRLHPNHLFAAQTLDEGQHFFYARKPLYVANGHGFLLGECPHDGLLRWRKMFDAAVKLRADDHRGFAVEPETGGQCASHHFALAAHIIVRHPLPKANLHRVHNGFFVQERDNVFGVVRGFAMMNVGHNARIHFARPERYARAHAHSQSHRHIVRNGVGKPLFKRQG